MTARGSNRKTDKQRTQQMKQVRKHKWHLQEAWMQVNEIKKHLDSMESSGDVLCNQSTATIYSPTYDATLCRKA